VIGATQTQAVKPVQAVATASRLRARHVAHAVRPLDIQGPLPGALLIADRGNDRMLLVDPQHRVLWRFPTARDLARGTRVYFNDDGFVEPGGKAIVANEEESHTIISVNIKTHAVTKGSEQSRTFYWLRLRRWIMNGAPGSALILTGPRGAGAAAAPAPPFHPVS